MAYRILIADDEPYVVMAITSILVDLPAEVLEAADGDQVLLLAKAEHLDLILLDIKMPGLDGFQVATALKQDPATAAIPIMFVSALGAPAEKARGLELGADDYIAKPIDGEELKALVCHPAPEAPTPSGCPDQRPLADQEAAFADARPGGGAAHDRSPSHARG
jgi:CheY-like chemotaxis protein